MNQATPVRLEAAWLAQLGEEFEQPYMGELKAFLLQQKRQGEGLGG